MTGAAKAAALPLAAALLLLGCQQDQQPEAAAPPFLFRALELRQKGPDGQPAWEITSPEARYDLGRKLAQARELRGLIYAKGKPLYRVSATRGVVLNDGEVVQLEGPTTVERLGNNPLVITALQVRWYPQQGRMLLDRQPTARQQRLQLTARQAMFDFNDDRLTLSGQPLLIDRGEPQIRLQLKRLQWWAESGDLIGDGPVQGERIEPSIRRQTLTSPALAGNSLRQEIVLAAPVRLVDASQQAELRAQATRLDLKRNTVSSGLPFEGRRGAITIRGQGFSLLNGTNTAIIPRGCELQQPGDQLTAERCSWNWRTNRVEASGGVELRRRDQGQITRAERLDGLASKDGNVVFSQPGGRVTTQLQLPAGQRPGSRSQRSRPPVQL